MLKGSNLKMYIYNLQWNVECSDASYKIDERDMCEKWHKNIFGYVGMSLQFLKKIHAAKLFEWYMSLSMFVWLWETRDLDNTYSINTSLRQLEKLRRILNVYCVYLSYPLTGNTLL